MTDPTQNPDAAPEPTTPAVVKKKSAARFVTPALALVAALVVGGVAGVLIGQNTAASGPSAMGRPGGFVADGGGPQLSGGPNGRGGLTAGTIESIDGDTLTVKLEDGTTVTVTTDGDTSVTETTDAAVGDLETGDEITVVGEKDDDGNVAADSISQGGAFMMGGPTNRDQSDSQ